MNHQANAFITNPVTYKKKTSYINLPMKPKILILHYSDEQVSLVDVDGFTYNTSVAFEWDSMALPLRLDVTLEGHRIVSWF
jgi:hypothetical protein